MSHRSDSGAAGAALCRSHAEEEGRGGRDPAELAGHAEVVAVGPVLDDPAVGYLAIDAYERLVLTQGWPPGRYSAWLAHALTCALCP
jgi:hypothetical protein